MEPQFSIVNNNMTNNKNNSISDFPEPLPILKLVKKENTNSDHRSTNDWVLESPPSLTARKIYNEQVIEENDWSNLRKEHKMKKLLQVNHRPDCKIVPFLSQENGNFSKQSNTNSQLVTRNRSVVNENLKKKFIKHREDEAKPYSVKLVNQYDRIFKCHPENLSLYKQYCKFEKRVDSRNIFESIQNHLSKYPNIPQISTPYQNFLSFLIDSLQDKDRLSLFKEIDKQQMKELSKCKFYIDIATIRKKIRFMFYQTVWYLKADVRLLLENFIKLSPHDNVFHQEAVKLWIFAKTELFTEKFMSQFVSQFPPLTIDRIGLTAPIPMEELLNPEFDLKSLEKQFKESPRIWLEMAIQQQRQKQNISQDSNDISDVQNHPLPSHFESRNDFFQKHSILNMKNDQLSNSQNTDKYHCPEVEKALINPDRSTMESMSSILTILTKGKYNAKNDLSEPKPISFNNKHLSENLTTLHKSAIIAPELDDSLMKNQSLIEQLNPGTVSSSSSSTLNNGRKVSVDDVEKNLLDILKKASFPTDEQTVNVRSGEEFRISEHSKSPLLSLSSPTEFNRIIYSLLTSDHSLFSV